MKILANVKANLSNKTIDVRMDRQVLTLTNDMSLGSNLGDVELFVGTREVNDYLVDKNDIIIAGEQEVLELFLNLLEDKMVQYYPDDYIISATLRVAYFIENSEGYIDESKCVVGNIKIQRFHK